MLVLPGFYAYTAITNQHQFLENTIGTLPLENAAKERWDWIIILMPILILLSIPLQLGLIWAFNKHGHPWKRFFQEFSRLPNSKTTHDQGNVSSHVIG